MYDIKFFLRRNAQKKNGEIPINIRIKIGETHAKIYGTKVSVLENHWNDASSKVTGDDPLFFTKNEALKVKFSEAEKILLRLQLDNKLSYKSFEFQFEPEKAEKKQPPTPLGSLQKTVHTGGTDEPVIKTCFFALAKKYIDLKRADWSPDYLKLNETEITKIKQFRSSFYVEDVDYLFVAEYEQWMREHRDNCSNTVIKSEKVIKRVFKLARKMKIIQENPFDDHKVEPNPTSRDHLIMSELKILTEFYKSTTNEKLKNVLPELLTCPSVNQIFTYSIAAPKMS